KGDRNASRAIWRALYASDPDLMKENALRHLRNLDALDRADLVAGMASAFRARAGRWPSSLDELASVTGVSVRDPAGVPFRYDSGTGVVTLDPKSPLWLPPQPALH